MGEVSCSENFQKKFRDLTLEYQEGYFKSKILKINPLSRCTMVSDFPGCGQETFEQTEKPSIVEGSTSGVCIALVSAFRVVWSTVFPTQPQTRDYFLTPRLLTGLSAGNH